MQNETVVQANARTMRTILTALAAYKARDEARPVVRGAATAETALLAPDAVETLIEDLASGRLRLIAASARYWREVRCVAAAE